MEQRRTDYGVQASRTLVASYGSYAEAQRAVNQLSDNDFPVDKVSIVAEDLRFVERVTGRVGYGQAALNGLSSGAIAGALFGFVFGLFSLIDPLVSGLVLAFWGLVFGAIVGLIIGLISHALSGGRRDFSSAGQMEAGRYDVVGDADVADEATQLLADAR